MPIVKNSDSYTVIKKESLLTLLDRPIAFHRCLVDLTGSVSAALLLSQAIYWQNRCKSEDGWWWKTLEDWHAETGLSKHEVDLCRTKCKEFLEYELRGIPAKGHYRVKTDALETSFLNRGTEFTKSGKLCSPNRQTTVRTETSSETSSESEQETSFEEQWKTVPIKLKDEISLSAHKGFPEFVFRHWDKRDGRDGGGVTVRYSKLLQSRWIGEGEAWRLGCHAEQHKNVIPRNTNPTNYITMESLGMRKEDGNVQQRRP